MLRSVLLSICLVLPAAGVLAQSKEETCGLQAEVVSAIQKARLDKMRKGTVVETLMKANPDWPEAMAGAMPGLVDFVYDLRMRDLRKTDLGASSRQQCVDNWDQLQALTNTSN